MKDVNIVIGKKLELIKRLLNAIINQDHSQSDENSVMKAYSRSVTLSLEDMKREMLKKMNR